MYLNTFENTFKYFFKKIIHFKNKKKLGIQSRQCQNGNQFLCLLKRSLHYHLFIIEKNMTVNKQRII